MRIKKTASGLSLTVRPGSIDISGAKERQNLSVDDIFPAVFCDGACDPGDGGIDEIAPCVYQHANSASRIIKAACVEWSGSRQFGMACPS